MSEVEIRQRAALEGQRGGRRGPEGQGWQNAGKYEYFPCRWYLLVNTGKYWKLAFTTLEVRQNPTLSINLWTMSVIGAT